MTINIEETNVAPICSVPSAIFGTGDNAVCVRFSDGASIPLNSREASVLSRLSTSRPLSEHLKSLVEEDAAKYTKERDLGILGRLLRHFRCAPSNEPHLEPSNPYETSYQNYVKDVARLMAKGMVLPTSDALREILSSSEQITKPCRITSLCIPTSNRPHALAQCVASFMHRLAAQKRGDATIFVVDDSATESSELRNRKALAAVKDQGEIEVRFVGHNDRARMIRNLTDRGGAPAEVVQFALRPDRLLTTEGSARNAMLLLTAGQFAMHTDDDTSCSYASASQSDQVTVSGAPDNYQTYIYQDRESNLREFPVDASLDPFTMHEAVLGHHVTDILSCARSVTWDQINPHYVACQHSDNDRIGVVSSGASGDPGMQSRCAFTLYSPQNTLGRLSSDPEMYKRAVTCREVLRVVPHLTLSRTALFQTMSFSIDNTLTQPPFFPMGREHDNSFARIYELCNSGSYIAHIPFSISHISEPNRQYTISNSDAVCALRLNNILQLCLASLSRGPMVTGRRKLSCIGQQLVEIGLMSKRAFRAFISARYVERQMRSMSKIDSIWHATHRTACEEWRRDIESVMRRLKSSVLEAENIAPRDLLTTLNFDAALDRTQGFIRIYGQLVETWDALTDAAVSTNLLQ